MKWIVFLMALSILACPGCASIICTGEKTVNIKSSPARSNFEIFNSYGDMISNGITPTNVTLKRGSGYFAAGDYTIEFSKDGFQSRKMPMPQGIETGWYFFGNAVFGGLIGWLIVDPLTGAMWNIKDINISLSPDPYYKTQSNKDSGRKFKGYKATIDPATGKPVKIPVYEEK